MRVAIITETFLPKVDGIVKVVCLLLDHLEKREIEAMVIAPDYGEFKAYHDFPVVNLPSLSFPLYPEARMGLATPTLFRQLSDFQPDVAHLFHPMTTGIPTMGMLKWQNVPTVTSFHLDYARLANQFKVGYFDLGFTRPILELMTKNVFNWADYSLAPSKLIQQQMQELGIEQVGLWRRGVDAETFNPKFYSDEMRHELSEGKPDDTLLLYVGRLSNEKQIEHIRPVLENVPNTRLALVGDGPARAHLEQYFKGLPVKFMGYMRGEALSQAYASADIFTFPSSLETFGLVVVEAMAAGLPVVASRVGGVSDVINIGLTGYTFDAGDIQGLIEGVRKVAISRNNIKQMGQAARAFAETQSWDAMMDEVVDLYAHLIESHHQAAVSA